MNITEKAAFAKGLIEGLDLDVSTPSGKMIQQLTSLISDMADEIAVLKERVNTLSDYVEELDEDLGSVEELLYDDASDDDDDDDDDDTDFYEVECPSCGETVCFDDTIDPSSVTCPACGEKFDCTCTAEDCESCPGCSEE